MKGDSILNIILELSLQIVPSEKKFPFLLPYKILFDLFILFVTNIWKADTSKKVLNIHHMQASPPTLRAQTGESTRGDKEMRNAGSKTYWKL